MNTPTGNVVTLAFGRKRRRGKQLGQLKVLISRVLCEIYEGKYAEMLVSYEIERLQDPKLDLKRWLQEQLGAVAVNKAI